MSENNLFTFEGYHARFCNYLKVGYTNRAAWEKTEEEYQNLTQGVAKYASYESFASTMYRELKKPKS